MATRAEASPLLRALCIPPQMSAHLPLERLAATFLAALLHLGTTAPDPAPFLEAASKALGTHPEMAEEQRAQAALRWQMCGLAAARVLSWMSQVGAASI
jgi:hypothetical protein